MNTDKATFVGFYTHGGFWPVTTNQPYGFKDLSGLIGLAPEVALEIDAPEIQVKVCVDGLVLLRISHLDRSRPDMSDPHMLQQSVVWWASHLDYAHTLQLCLESASIACDRSSEIQVAALTPSETCRIVFQNGVAISRVNSRNASTLDTRQRALARAQSLGDPLASALDPDWEAWRRVSYEAITSAFELFKIIFPDPNLVKRLAMIVQAQAAFARCDYKISFVLLWFVIESATREIASLPPKSHLSQSINYLRNSCSFSTTTLNELDALRKHRNNLMHEPGDTVCTPTQCVRAGQTALDVSMYGRDSKFFTKWVTGTEF
ncbi:hypothetical protein [Xanthomonas campestris]|uniref:hypothetical protein n=1 Tax=Xanthomonas cannabis TaxID=1885674 RepID=UPI001E44F15B|nr:hypothetical protein [Xanthomonas campestris pv. zinniae]